jgi:hypothetical protein
MSPDPNLCGLAVSPPVANSDTTPDAAGTELSNHVVLTIHLDVARLTL